MCLEVLFDPDGVYSVRAVYFDLLHLLPWGIRSFRLDLAPDHTPPDMFYVEKHKARVKTQASAILFFYIIGRFYSAPAPWCISGPTITASIQNTSGSVGFPFNSPVMHLGAYYYRFYPEHISQFSGSSNEHVMAAWFSSIDWAVGTSSTFLSIVNLIASVAALVRR